MDDSKYKTDIQDAVQGFVQGEGNTIINIFLGSSDEKPQDTVTLSRHGLKLLTHLASTGLMRHGLDRATPEIQQQVKTLLFALTGTDVQTEDSTFLTEGESAIFDTFAAPKTT
jgi:hypothetical protein